MPLSRTLPPTRETANPERALLLRLQHGPVAGDVLAAESGQTRAAVWKRVELLRKGFPSRIILAVGKQLRVSEEVLEEGAAGELYVYKATMSARAVLERLRRDGAKR